MNKKSLLISIACTVVATLGLAIYTLVTLLGVKAPVKPTNTTVALAFRTNDEIVELSSYTEEQMSFEYSDETNPSIIFDEATGKYFAAKGGNAEVVVELDSLGNKKTFNISVYDQAFDTDGHPTGTIVLTSKAHLLEYAQLAKTEDAKGFRGFDVVLQNDIDITGMNWEPIGTREKPFFGSFDGNGHKIIGMNIHVTAQNFEDFIVKIDDKLSLYVGFFGSVDGLTEQGSFAVKAEVKNLGFEKAFIKIDSDVTSSIEAMLGTDTFIQSGIGVLAGRVVKGTIVGSDDYSSLTNCEINGYAPIIGSTDAGVGGLVGFALHSTNISNYNVNVTIRNDYEGATKNLIGGIAARLQNNHDGASSASIKNCNVDVKAVLRADNEVKFGGIVSILTNADIENVETIVDVRSISSEQWNDLVMTAVAGAVYSTEIDDRYNELTTTIKNVSVRINTSIFADVAGFAIFNNADIVDCAVAYASIDGYNTSGFVYNNYKNISYTENFEGNAVKATLRGFFNSGFAYINGGSIVGYADADENYTKVNVTINSRNAIYGSAEISDRFANTAGSAGLVNKLYSKDQDVSVSNFDVIAVIKNDVNQVGLVFSAGTYEQTKTATISNIKVNATLTSAQIDNGGKDISTTKYMAGAVARMFGNAIIDNVNVSIKANENANENKLYGVEFFGGLVARILEDGATIKNSYVSGYAYFNTSNYFVQISEDDETAKYQVSLIGGLIGAITNDELGATEGKITDTAWDKYSAVADVSNIVITNNTVQDLTLVVNIGNNDEVTAGHKTASRWRFRALGATIGSINNGSGAINLNKDADSKNVVINVQIKTNVNDYTFSTSENDNNSSLSNSTRSYGIANLPCSTDVDVSDIRYI